MLSNKEVCIAVLNQGGVRPELAELLMKLPEQRKYNLHVLYPAEKPITHNRNSVVKYFLTATNADYLLMLDGDIVPPMDILNLADYQKDIVGALCFAYQKGAVIPLALKKNKENLYDQMELHEGDGLVECDAVGTGAIMISRKVLADFKMKFPFKNQYDKNGIKIKGLDLYFCDKAKSQGYKVFIHTGFKCDHWTTLNLRTIYSTYQHLKNDKKSTPKVKKTDTESK